MKNVAVDMKNKNIVDRMNETSANLKITDRTVDKRSLRAFEIGRAHV